MKVQMIAMYILLNMLGTGFAFAQCNSKANKKQEKEKIKVFLLGSFHFAQMDESYNVLDPKHQESIKELCELVSIQNPDKVFVERQPEYEFQNKIDSQYQVYLKTGVIPQKNELFQLGFRIAKDQSHSRLYQCDHPGSYGRFMKETAAYAIENNQEEILDAKSKGTTQREDNLVQEASMMQDHTLLEHIRLINSKEWVNSSHSNYLTTYPQVGSTNFYDYEEDYTLIGAELLADWYRRNIMIYSKMINQVDYNKDEAILLIIGSDHVPIIRNLFRDNPYFEVIDPAEWLYSQRTGCSR